LRAVEGPVCLPDDAAFTELSAHSLQGHRQGTDADLLHLARKHGRAFASGECRMTNWEGPAQLTLFVVA
jgi:hypothetical protein